MALVSFAAAPAGDREPAVVTPGTAGSPPSDAVVLFDGKDLSAWKSDDGSEPKWKLENGHMEVHGKGLMTRQEFGAIQLHLEWASPAEVKGDGQGRGNSGVYFQGRYEIQVLDGDKTPHGMAAVINETPSPYHAYNGTGKWNAYDINFRAARFKDGKLVEKPLVSMYFNGQLVHTNVTIQQVWGGPNSGIDGGNDGGKGITDSPGGLKLQNEGHDVRYRNIWIRELNLKKADTRF